MSDSIQHSTNMDKIKAFSICDLHRAKLMIQSVLDLDLPEKLQNFSYSAL